MDIKAETYKDKIYNHIIKYVAIYIGGIVGLGFVSWGISTDVKNMHEREALQVKLSKDFQKKVASVIDNKPYLVCGGKTKVYLNADQYDITTINGIHYVVTQATKDTPMESETMDNCSIVETKTKSMVVVVPKVIPIDEQHEVETQKLRTQLSKLQSNALSHGTQLSTYLNTLDTANSRISELKDVVLKQDKELSRLLLIEAKYKEVKTLLTIVLDKKDINIAELVVKKQKPKKVAVKIKKIMGKVKEPLVVKLPIIPIGEIVDNEDYIKRMIYIIKEIPSMHKQTLTNTTINHIMRRPTLKDLESITLTKAQMANVPHVKKQLNLAIDGMIKSYTGRFKIDTTVFRNNIRSNVGI